MNCKLCLQLHETSAIVRINWYLIYYCLYYIDLLEQLRTHTECSIYKPACYLRTLSASVAQTPDSLYEPQALSMSWAWTDAGSSTAISGTSMTGGTTVLASIAGTGY